MNIYCMKCITKTSTKDIVQFLNKKGKPMMKGSCCKCKIVKPQLLPNKEGVFVFTLPMLAVAAEAAGSLAGGASTIDNAVNQKKNAGKVLAETEIHNKAMESKNGTGFVRQSETLQRSWSMILKPYKV